MAKAVKKNNNLNKTSAGLIVIIFVVAFGLGFLTNNFLNAKINSDQSQKSILINASGRFSSINVVAVTEDGTGVIGKANIELVSGRGRILANTNPFIEPDTQQSVETAVSYAINYTNIDFRNYDIIVSFNMSDVNGNPIDPRGQIIGGPSAGAALTIATVAVAEGRTIKDNIAVTGTIEPDGKVGRVGSVPEKADAAGQAGLDLFIVPQGQAGVTEYRKVVTTDNSGPYVVRKVNYIPSTTSLDAHTKEKYNMSVYEISKVEDSFNIVFVSEA